MDVEFVTSFANVTPGPPVTLVRASPSSDATDLEPLRKVLAPSNDFLDFKVDNALTEGHLKRIYIRNCYKHLYDIMMANHNCLLIGTPGIGKSHAIYYFIYRILNDKDRPTCTILLCTKESRHIVYRKTNSVITWSAHRGAPSTDLIDQLSSDHTFYIYDSVAPILTRSLRGRFWLVTSPRKEIWNDFVKTYYPVQLLMPVFDLSEMLKMLCLYEDITEETVIARHRKWGGSARSVFHINTQILQAGIEVRVNDALTNANSLIAVKASVIENSNGSSFGLPEHSMHDIMHMRSDTYDLTGKKLMFASKYMFNRAREAMMKMSYQERRSFLATLDDARGLEGSAGNLFQINCQSYLFDGVNQSISFYQLGRPNGMLVKEEFPLSKRKTVCFYSEKLQEVLLTLDNSSVLVPYDSSFPSVDFITKEADIYYLWQMTVSVPHKHPIKAPIVLQILKTIPGKDVRFIWVTRSRNQTKRPKWPPVSFIPSANETRVTPDKRNTNQTIREPLSIQDKILLNRMKQCVIFMPNNEYLEDDIDDCVHKC